jgi:hypothetical protein
VRGSGARIVTSATVSTIAATRVLLIRTILALQAQRVEQGMFPYVVRAT